MKRFFGISIAMAIASFTGDVVASDYGYDDYGNPTHTTAPTRHRSAHNIKTPPAVKLEDGILVNAKGMTLYVFDKDVVDSGKSACNGNCAVQWPPLSASDRASNVGDFSIVTRNDGKKQWAYKGHPLYLWAGDQKPGDATGDGVGGVWHTITP